MKILFVVSEVEPLAKTGGLADVAAALPKAMKFTPLAPRPTPQGVLKGGGRILHPDELRPQKCVAETFS